MDPADKIAFWDQEAQRALAVAKDLLSLKRYLEALFFGHLALEKRIKAKVTATTRKDPVFSHDLVLLAKYANLPLTLEEQDFLVRVNVYNIRARYQDYQRSLYRRANRRFTTRELEEIEAFFRKIA